MDFNEAHTHTRLVEVLLRREKLAGLGTISWGAAMLIIATATMRKEDFGFNFFSGLLAVSIGLIFLIGLARIFLGFMNVSRVSSVPFIGAATNVFVGEGPRLSLLAVTADNGRELSWDIFDAELVQEEYAINSIWRLDHVDERFFKKLFLKLGLRSVPKLFGRRLYSWLVMIPRGVAQITIRAKNQIQVEAHRTRIVIIELVWTTSNTSKEQNTSGLDS